MKWSCKNNFDTTISDFPVQFDKISEELYKDMKFKKYF